MNKIIVSLSIIILLSSCSNTEKITSLKSKPKTSISKKETKVIQRVVVTRFKEKLFVGEKIIFNAEVNYFDKTTDKDIVWESSDSESLEIDENGNVLAKKPGLFLIIAKSKQEPEKNSRVVVQVIPKEDSDESENSSNNLVKEEELDNKVEADSKLGKESFNLIKLDVADGSSPTINDLLVFSFKEDTSLLKSIGLNSLEDSENPLAIFTSNSGNNATIFGFLDEGVFKAVYVIGKIKPPVDLSTKLIGLGSKPDLEKEGSYTKYIKKITFSGNRIIIELPPEAFQQGDLVLASVGHNLSGQYSDEAGNKVIIEPELNDIEFADINPIKKMIVSDQAN